MPWFKRSCASVKKSMIEEERDWRRTWLKNGMIEEEHDWGRAWLGKSMKKSMKKSMNEAAASIEENDRNKSMAEASITDARTWLKQKSAGLTSCWGHGCHLSHRDNNEEEIVSRNGTSQPFALKRTSSYIGFIATDAFYSDGTLTIRDVWCGRITGI